MSATDTDARAGTALINSFDRGDHLLSVHGSDRAGNPLTASGYLIVATRVYNPVTHKPTDRYGVTLADTYSHAMHGGGEEVTVYLDADGLRSHTGRRRLTIGDRTRDGLLEITDTRWDSNGTLFVTVRELIGTGCWTGGLPIARMRRLARRALAHPDKTRSSRVVRRWSAQGCDHVTFAVSRLP